MQFHMCMVAGGGVGWWWIWLYPLWDYPYVDYSANDTLVIVFLTIHCDGVLWLGRLALTCIERGGEASFSFSGTWRQASFVEEGQENIQESWPGITLCSAWSNISFVSGILWSREKKQGVELGMTWNSPFFISCCLRSLFGAITAFPASSTVFKEGSLRILKTGYCNWLYHIVYFTFLKGLLWIKSCFLFSFTF